MVDAALCLNNTDVVVVVAENVRCYLLFEAGLGFSERYGSAYVDREMLSALDEISMLVDPTRPRLLVIVADNVNLCSTLRVDASCLPADFPTIVVG